MAAVSSSERKTGRDSLSSFRVFAINRLKAIKRQMYGRAGFALLKARVMPFVEPTDSCSA
jgi:hypothetical protein